MSIGQRYERYRSWCQSLDIEPASYEVWAREISKISEISAIKGYGSNVVQSS